MDELDEVWEHLIAEAARQPQEIAQAGLAEFIAVKTANDQIREMHMRRLLDTIRRAAEHANLKNARITIENTDSHIFKLDRMQLRGSLLKLRQGIRCLTIEAGWTRTPADGFMRGNALAVAQISHFGIARENAELHLLKFEDHYQWFTVGKNSLRTSFEVEDLIRHLQIFLGVH